MVKNVVVLGAGSAGLLSAITLKRHTPALGVTIVRSPEIGVIGVGESTTPQFPKHVFEILKISRKHFYKTVNPTWKMGIHFLWGPRDCFEYTFDSQLDTQWDDLPKPNAYYCQDDFSNVNLNSALMKQAKAFVSQPDGGGPLIPGYAAFHLHNPDLVAGLEMVARDLGITIIDGKMKSAIRGANGIETLILQDDRRVDGDFFVDCSGFRSELLGRELAEPFVSYSPSLFCDRAVVGSWERTDEFIYPYTIAETMDAGWCWQIDHEKWVNRGYVYSSQFMSEDMAREEFLRKNPKAKTWDHVVKFRSGRHQRSWVENVVAIGNASGFVEPLEATALMVVCGHCQMLSDMLRDADFQPTESMRTLYNRAAAEAWDEIRDFLSIHYRYNTRLNTPFWQACRADVDVSGCAELLKFYDENGPTGLCRHNLRFLSHTHSQFGLEGYLVILTGNRVPYRQKYQPTEAEWKLWRSRQAKFKSDAEMAGMTVKQALAYIKDPRWRWHGDDQ